MQIKIVDLDNGHLMVNRDFLGFLDCNRLQDAQAIWDLRDESVKTIVKERRTGRAFLTSPNGLRKVEVYIKRYTRASLSERVKNIMSLKFFQFDALHEWHAQLAFHRLELPTVIPIAAGRVSEGSFNLTLGISDYKRASVLLDPKGRTDKGVRANIIKQIGLYTGRMHRAGIAHQDLYLVHFFLKGKDMIPHLIDLQRVIKEKELSDRWRIKDLAELLFSARPMVSEDEIRIFCKAYSRAAGFELKRHTRLVKAIIKKADRIEARHRRKMAENNG